jgi:hypothetical protein
MSTAKTPRQNPDGGQPVKQFLVSQRHSLLATGRINLNHPKINSLRDFGVQRHLTVLDISKTALQSLDSLQPQPCLAEIIATESQLDSYLGLSRQPQLQKLFIEGTPLSQRPNFRLFCSIVAGQRLGSINGIPITKPERDRAKAFPKIARNLLEAGSELPDHPVSESEFRRLADDIRLQVNGKLWSDLPNHQVQALFALPAVFSLKSPAEESLQAEKLAETQKSEVEKSEESADGQLVVSIAKILETIGIRVGTGEQGKEDIVQALAGLVGAIRLLEGCQEEGGAEEEVAEVEEDVAEEEEVLQ